MHNGDETLSAFQQAILPLKNAFSSGQSAPIPGGIGYIKGDSIHADQIHLGQIGEGNHSIPLTYLTDRAKFDSPIYLGVGGILNLSYAAKLKPARVVLFDVNPLQTLFWDEAIKHLKTDTLAEFLNFIEASQDVIKDRLHRDFQDVEFSTAGCLTNTFNVTPRPSSPLQWERGFFRGLSPKSWLSHRDSVAHTWVTPEHYATLQKIACDGEIEAITLDILDTERCRSVGNFLKRDKPQNGVIYINSLRQFMNGRSDWTGRQNLAATQENLNRNIGLLLQTPQKIVIEDHTLNHLNNNIPQSSLRF